MNGAELKRNNLQMVFSAISEAGQVSRAELVRETGLTAATITNLCKQLLAQGMVLEEEKQESTGGRRAVNLAVNADAFHVAGLELLVTDLVGVLLNARREIVGKKRLPIELSRGREFILDQMADFVHRILDEAGVPMANFIGMGLASPGPIDYAEMRVLNPPNFADWKNVRAAELLAERLHKPVWLEKETQAAALGEHYFGRAQHSKRLFFCNIFEIGIGGGIVNEGVIDHGNGYAAEIGHVHVEGGTRRCSCGATGCLETIADGRSTLARIEEKYGRKLSFAAMIAAAEAGDAELRTEILDSADKVAMALTNVVRVLSPDTVVIGGDFPEQCALFRERCLEKMREQLSFYANKDLAVYCSDLDCYAAAIGGAALAFNELILT